MQACQKHEKCVVVFNRDGCPLCKVETILKTLGGELERSMTILKELKREAEEAGLKLN